MFGCYNGCAARPFSAFLKTIDPLLYDEYRLEKYRDNQPIKRPKKDYTPPKSKVVLDVSPRLIDSLMDRLDTLPEDNKAVQYAIKRQIPKDKYPYLYYVDDVSKMEQLSEKYRDKIKGTEPRLVLPFFDWSGKMIGFTARALGDESLRYLTVKIDDEAPMIFGTETFDKSKKGYVVEGPIDSLFLPNCLAVAGTAFNKLDEVGLDKSLVTLILDNQPRNREVVKVYNRFIERGWKILLWPQNINGKDINEIILNGLTSDELVSIIDKNTHQGLSAKLAFTNWKKI